jgi:hypothetical protein
MLAEREKSIYLAACMCKPISGHDSFHKYVNSGQKAVFFVLKWKSRIFAVMLYDKLVEISPISCLILGFN